MSEWLGTVVLSISPESKEPVWEFEGVLIFISDDGHRVTVTGGFETDGASIPRMFYGLIGGPFSGRYVAAAVIHDALYASHLVSRELADELFLEAMRESGVPAWKARVMYWAVRAGGRAAWKKHSAGKEVREHVLYARLDPQFPAYSFNVD